MTTAGKGPSPLGLSSSAVRLTGSSVNARTSKVIVSANTRVVDETAKTKAAAIIASLYMSNTLRGRTLI